MPPAVKCADASAGEASFIRSGCLAGLRSDGRGCTQYRTAQIDLGVFPHASGSCRLQLGGTLVTAAVCAEISSPPADRPGEGRVNVLVSSHSLAADVPALQRALERLLTAAGCGLPLEQLAIIQGEQCWEMLVACAVLRSDGNELDALAMAVAGALCDTRLPKVTPISVAQAGDHAMLELDEDITEYSQLDVTRMPLYVTVALVGGQRVFDCTALEEACASATVSVACSADGTQGAVAMAGPEAVDVSELRDVLKAARAQAATLHASFWDEIFSRREP
ncbi:ribosomal protein S5 domain 2-type protein [Pavlovales sp. CCMP2436]|nr:ribosomal protein S5 domain 2-type protein [Pavlovales sp. CCMP2436]